MENQNLRKKIISQAKIDKVWLENAKNRQINRSWLDLSFKIAMKVLRYIRINKISQKDLASKLDWSPQYLSKVLKGKENLTLETICKIQGVTGLSLIQVPIVLNEIEIHYDSKDIILEISLKDIKKKMPIIKSESSYLKDQEELSTEINEELLVAA